MRRLILIMLCSLSLFSLEAQKNNQGAKKINIRDIFLMLPEQAVDNRWSVEERKKLLTHVGVPAEGQEWIEPYVEVCDERNGYLRAYLSYPDPTLEVCYWNLKDGRKLVGVNNTFGYSDLKFYIYDRGRLCEDRLLAPKVSEVKVEDFYDLSQLSPKQRATLTDIFKHRLVFLFKLPQKGTSIEMYVGAREQDAEYDTMFDDLGLGDLVDTKYVVFRWVNEQWIKEVKRIPRED